MTGCVCALCLGEQDRDGIFECVYTRMSLPGLQWHLSSAWMEVQCCAWGGSRGKSGCQQALRLCWGSAAPWKYLLYQRKLSKHIFCPWLQELQAWFFPAQNHHFELFFYNELSWIMLWYTQRSYERSIYTEVLRKRDFCIRDSSWLLTARKMGTHRLDQFRRPPKFTL